MKQLLRKITRKAAAITAPFIPLKIYRQFLRKHPVGFFYHVVSDHDLPHVKHLYPYKNQAAFEADLRFIKSNFTVIGYSDLLAAVTNQAPLPDNAAFVSFDDGFIECATVVRPLLEQYEIPCTFFITTDFVDNQKLYYRNKVSLCIEKLLQSGETQQQNWLSRVNQTFQLSLSSPQAFATWIKSHQQTEEPLIDQVCMIFDMEFTGENGFLNKHTPFLSKDQLRQLHAAGFTIGAHGRAHLKLQYMSPEAQAEEIAQSCQTVSEWLGVPQVPFAFPFSGEGVNRDMLAQLRANNPSVGLIFDTKKLRPDSPFIFHRIWVDKPLPGVAPEQAAAQDLHQAYQEALAERFR